MGEEIVEILKEASPVDVVKGVGGVVLSQALAQVASHEAVGLDSGALTLCVRTRVEQGAVGRELAGALATDLGWRAGVVLEKPDEARLPMLIGLGSVSISAGPGDAVWGVVVGVVPLQDLSGGPRTGWLLAGPGHRVVSDEQIAFALEIVAGQEHLQEMVEPQHGGADVAGSASKGLFMRSMLKEVMSHKGVLGIGLLASLYSALINLGTSFFSMQVYDRVVPTGALSTLQVLFVGLVFATLADVAMKVAKSKMTERMSAQVDAHMSREVFERLLSIRLDQFPMSVGSLAGQIRGYEQVRAMITGASLYALVELPMGLLFALVMLMLGGPLLVLPAVVCAALALVLGWLVRKRVDEYSMESAKFGNRKMGLLIETVEGAPTWKSAAGGWMFLGRWLRLSEGAIVSDLKSRQVSGYMSYAVGALQQLAYATVVAVGAWEAAQGTITTGVVIACSILSGKVLSPVLALPGLMVQWSTAKAAASGVERIYTLGRDLQAQGARVFAPENLKGGFELQGVEFSYAGAPGEKPLSVLSVPRLQIGAGERVAVLGPIGSGKSTLLKMLTGMYAPGAGLVRMDGLDMGQLHATTRSGALAYLAQEHRLFEGNLRENLLLGKSEVDVDALKRAMVSTGLMELVSAHPKGLDLPIHEGGTGLSGGQRQLVAFTRLLLGTPSAYLLDEPTASMDGQQEMRCLGALKAHLDEDRTRTLVVVTHKPAVLGLVDRLIVVAGGRVVMDGPKQEVLARLGAQGQQVQPAQPGQGAPAQPQQPSAQRQGQSFAVQG